MPQLGETVTEGTITKWFKAVGDPVARDEPLFEVSTDKVDSEVPSPAEGVLTAILVEEGDTVDVGVKLAVIGDGSANGHGRPAATAGEPPPPPRRRRPGAAAARVSGARPGARPRLRRHGTARCPPAPPSPPSPPLRPRPGLAGRRRRPRHRPGRRSAPARAWSCRRWCASCCTRTASTRPPSRGPGLGGRITRSDVESVIAGGARIAPAGPVPSRPASPSIADRRTGRPRPRRPTRPRRRRRRRRRHARPDRRAATRWSRSPTSGDAPPSTWSGPRPPRPTP